MRALLYVWSSPCGLVGLLVEVLFRALGWRYSSYSNREMLVQGPLSIWLWRRGWTATTIGWSIFYWTQPYMRTARHEARHVQQWMWFGPLLPLAYLVCLAIWGYRENPFERDARRNSG